jgi:hypothetical protein
MKAKLAVGEPSFSTAGHQAGDFIPGMYLLSSP